MNKSQLYLICTLGIYFGWLLSFPFYGPLLSSFTQDKEIHVLYSYVDLFLVTHCISFFLGALFLHNTSLWHKSMCYSLAITILFSSLFLFSANQYLLLLSMGVLGIVSSIFILGWSCIFSTSAFINNRFANMALIIILANIIYILFDVFSKIIDYKLLITGLLLLLASNLILLLRAVRIKSELDLIIEESRGEVINNTRFSNRINIAYLALLSLFVFGLYINAGFIYTVMQPSFVDSTQLLPYISYISTLLLFYFFAKKLTVSLLAYWGISILGLSFVAFVLFEKAQLSILLSRTLIDAAYATIDLFVWVLLAIIAYKYRQPYKVFGFVLGSMLLSIIIGNVLSDNILALDTNYQELIGIFAIVPIFLTLLILPIINSAVKNEWTSKPTIPDNVTEDNQQADSYSEDILLQNLLQHIEFGAKLTEREVEIVGLIIKGQKNNEIAEMLFITNNTLKTHLRNIYAKFSVNRKIDLISLTLKKDNTTELP